jgi:hypothetical protein
VQICGKQVRKRGEILLDVDSTDDPTYGQQLLSFFNGGYDQHMYHPLLIFERHTGCRDRLSCHRLRANAFRLLLHSFAYNLVNLFRLQLPSSLRSAQIETLRIQLFKIGRASAKPLVASAFTWPAAGLSRISSKPSATPLRLSRRLEQHI